MLSTDQPVRHTFSSPLQKAATTLNLHHSSTRHLSSSRLMTSPQNGTLSLPTKHMWIITGPAGSGKTTVAKFLADTLNLPYVEGDDWHTPANKKKMNENHPLTDGDRWDWLVALREEALRTLSSPSTTANGASPATSVIVTCSALKHKYRDVLRIASVEQREVAVHFLYLKVDEATLKERVRQRQGHYMKDSMVHSQMEALEEPDLLLEPDVIPVESRVDVGEVQRAALERVREKLAEYEG